MLKLFSSVFLISISSVYSKRPVIKIQNGKVRGEIMMTPNNRTFYAFRGIPYAKPPLGELRFQPPQKPENWEGISNSDAKDRMCIQITSQLLPNESEDCLYIHVYTPQIPTEEPMIPLPVMYVIHGGAFILGTPTPDMMGPQYSMDHNVVIVSVGYRLGFLGFLATEDLNCPGNNGLKDQQLGSRWVQENIRMFGGDPNRVTIFGESAGAASVGYQLVGSNAKGSFIGAIQNSGSSLVTWGMQKNPKKIAFRFANHINAAITENNTSTLELLKFFRTLDVQQIKRACVEVFGEGLLACHDNLLSGFVFSGTIEPEHEGAFLTKAPYKKFLEGDFTVVPTMLGVTTEESLFLGNDSTSEKKIARYEENPENYVLENMRVAELKTRKEVGKTIRKMYETDFSGNKKAAAIRYFSDTTFNRPVIKQAESQSKFTDVYFYVFGYSGEMGKCFSSSDIPGAEKVAHAEDMMFLFQSHESKDIYSFSQQDRTTMKRMLIMWTNFVKYQNPTPKRLEISQDIIWPKVRSVDRMPYLFINNTLKVKYNYKKNMLDAYQQLYDTHAGPLLETY